jgi:hypothetical protein
MISLFFILTLKAERDGELHTNSGGYPGSGWASCCVALC